MLVHVIQPDEECTEADHDEHLIPKGRYCIHNAEYELKETRYCIPET